MQQILKFLIKFVKTRDNSSVIELSLVNLRHLKWSHYTSWGGFPTLKYETTPKSVLYRSTNNQSLCSCKNRLKIKKSFEKYFQCKQCRGLLITINGFILYTNKSMKLGCWYGCHCRHQRTSNYDRLYETFSLIALAETIFVANHISACWWWRWQLNHPVVWISEFD